MLPPAQPTQVVPGHRVVAARQVVRVEHPLVAGQQIAAQPALGVAEHRPQLGVGQLQRLHLAGELLHDPVLDQHDGQFRDPGADDEHGQNPEGSVQQPADGPFT